MVFLLRVSNDSIDSNSEVRRGGDSRFAQQLRRLKLGVSGDLMGGVREWLTCLDDTVCVKINGGERINLVLTDYLDVLLRN